MNSRSYFYLFLDLVEPLQKKARADGQSEILDVRVDRVFESFRRHFGSQVDVEYYFDPVERLKEIQHFGLRNLPAFVVSDVDYFMETDVIEVPEAPTNRQKLKRVFTRVFSQKEQVVRFERDIISAVAQTDDQLFTFIRDLHYKLLADGIKGVDRRFLIQKAKVVGGDVSKAAKGAINVVKLTALGA